VSGGFGSDGELLSEDGRAGEGVQEDGRAGMGGKGGQVRGRQGGGRGGGRKLFDEVHGNGIPRTDRNGELSEESVRLVVLGLGA